MMAPHGWLVIQCKVGGWEERAQKELDKRGYATWLPRWTYLRNNRGTAVARREPMFPGYVFVAKGADVTLGALGLGKIRSTPGVIDVVSQACGKADWLPAMLGHPVMLEIERECERERERVRMLIEAMGKPKRFEAGSSATVLDGPFAGCVGIVARLSVVSPHERITLLLDICGGRVPVSLSATHVA
jgi:transcriptional antiterminator RfaH